MSDTFEEFVIRFEAASPASRSRVMDLILAERESPTARPEATEASPE